MRAFAVSLALILGFATAASADTGAALHVATDVIKPVLGLPNLELEVQIDRHMTANVFGEMLLWKNDMTPKGTGDASVRAGFRYFLWDFMDTQRASGLFGGLGAGALFNKLVDRPTAAVITEAGYKLVLFDYVQVMPSVLATIPLDGTAPAPGFELKIGAVL
jgi:hypothetical protein